MIQRCQGRLKVHASGVQNSSKTRRARVSQATTAELFTVRRQPLSGQPVKTEMARALLVVLLIAAAIQVSQTQPSWSDHLEAVNRQHAATIQMNAYSTTIGELRVLERRGTRRRQSDSRAVTGHERIEGAWQRWLKK